MRKSHYCLFAVAIATFGYVAAAPSLAASDQAQENTEAAESAALTPEQQSEYDTWPVGQQSEYELWPAETKGYFWSLTPGRQMLFWRLSDEDKIALTVMTGPERDGAWEQIEANALTAPPEG